MVDLSDIVPGTEEVSVPGGKVKLRGITNKEYQMLRSRFGLDKLDQQLRTGVMGEPQMAAAFIAAAAGQIGDEAAEAKYDDLPVGVAVALVNAAMKLTFGPFGEEANSPPKSSKQDLPSADLAEAPESPASN